MTLCDCLSYHYDWNSTISFTEPKSSALLAFSVITNGRNLLSYEAPKSGDMMNCLHGIRVISTQWVVLGHTYLMFIMLPIRNVSYYVEVQKHRFFRSTDCKWRIYIWISFFCLQFTSKYENMFIMSALISVDTFFVISGLLVSVNLLKHLEKTYVNNFEFNCDQMKTI